MLPRIVEAASPLNYYQSQLVNTYIAYLDAGNFTTNGDYVCIDGPNVWMEFSCQNGVISHTIYRDRGCATAVTILFTAFPNPVASGQAIDVVLAQTRKSATYSATRWGGGP